MIGLETPICTGGKSHLGQFSIPHTSLWCSGLLPKPGDWNGITGKKNWLEQLEYNSIMSADIAGYVPAKNLLHSTLPESLEQFLDILVLFSFAEFLESLKEA